MKVNKLVSFAFFSMFAVLVLINSARAAPDSVTKNTSDNLINNAEIPVVNLTGTISTECPTGQVPKNITLKEGNLSVVCINQTATEVPCSNVTGTDGELCKAMDFLNMSGDYLDTQNNPAVTINQSIIPSGNGGDGDDTYDLGTAEFQWHKIFVKEGLEIGDENSPGSSTATITIIANNINTPYRFELPRDPPNSNTYLGQGPGSTLEWLPLSIEKLVGTTSTQCTTGQILTNVTLNNGVLSSICIDHTSTTTLPASNITGFGLENKSASCNTVSCIATQTCSAGKAIMWGLSSTALTTCAGDPSTCNGYCQAGATSCSATAAVATASVVIYCGVFN